MGRPLRGILGCTLNRVVSAQVPAAAARRLYWAKTERDLAYDTEQIASWRATFPSLKEFTDEDLLEWRRVFDSFDLDSDGWISRADLQKRPEFSLDKVQKIERYDKDKNNLIDFGEFVEALYELDKEILKEGFEGFSGVDVQLEFEKFATTDASGQKSLSLGGIGKWLRASKFTCITKRDCIKLFNEIDGNRDGVVDLKDFQEDAQPLRYPAGDAGPVLHAGRMRARWLDVA
ncbi:probable calcium-binding protein CML17 [Cyclospora cayetanensis]|uniref:Probable calcium-binding protein CML17 n=1 Tax=Cyclospora cayetanensis TaxID=88456 RepID=A0A6P6RWI3_9EIME|nr:probable calcium-binding protein CML17 [Cyclospora cayetanensis]